MRLAAIALAAPTAAAACSSERNAQMLPRAESSTKRRGRTGCLHRSEAGAVDRSSRSLCDDPPCCAGGPYDFHGAAAGVWVDETRTVVYAAEAQLEASALLALRMTRSP